MALNKRSTMPFRRKRQDRTDYRRRLKLLSSKEIRLVVRLSERNALAQLVQYIPEGDKVLVSASTKELEKLGWKASKSSIPAAYLAGMLLAKKAAKLKQPVKRAILDIGHKTPLAGSRVFAVLRGAVDGGLELPHADKVLPSDERISGKHIEDYAKALKEGDADRYKRQFAAYIKEKVDPTTFTAYFNQFKGKIT